MASQKEKLQEGSKRYVGAPPPVSVKKGQSQAEQEAKTAKENEPSLADKTKSAAEKVGMAATMGAGLRPMRDLRSLLKEGYKNITGG